MTEITATEAARRFSDLLDAVEHRGEQFTVVRRGRVVARLEPIAPSRGAGLKAALRRHRHDATWSEDLASVRDLVEIEDRS